MHADLVIAQGAAVIAEMGWLPFLTKDIQIELSDGAYWPIFEKGMPIAANGLAHNEEEFSCVDSRLKRAKIIVGEGCGTKKDKNLTVLAVWEQRLLNLSKNIPWMFLANIIR